jgi:hypothetical protein
LIPTSARLLLLAVLTLVLALTVSACGESDDEKFVKEVNAICEDSEQDVDLASDPEDVSKAFDEYLADIKAVDPPEGKKDDYEEWVRLTDGLVAEFKVALRSRDKKQLDLVESKAGPVDDEARRLGLDECD